MLNIYETFDGLFFGVEVSCGTSIFHVIGWRMTAAKCCANSFAVLKRFRLRMDVIR